MTVRIDLCKCGWRATDRTPHPETHLAALPDDEAFFADPLTDRFARVAEKAGRP